MKTKTVWSIAAPLKLTKKQALEDLKYCIHNSADRAKYRVVKVRSRWAIQYGQVQLIKE
jgi:hypothetical protein